MRLEIKLPPENQPVTPDSDNDPARDEAASDPRVVSEGEVKQDDPDSDMLDAGGSERTQEDLASDAPGGGESDVTQEDLATDAPSGGESEVPQDDAPSQILDAGQGEVMQEDPVSETPDVSETPGLLDLPPPVASTRLPYLITGILAAVFICGAVALLYMLSHSGPWQADPAGSAANAASAGGTKAGRPPPPSDAEEHAVRGVMALEGGVYEGAVVELREAIRLDSDHADWYFHLGRAARRSANDELAAWAYQAYLDRAPGGKYASEAAQRLADMAPQLTIGEVWADLDAKQNGRSGILVHTQFVAANLKNQRCWIGAFFNYDDTTSTPVKSAIADYQTTDGQTTIQESFTPGSQSARYDDYRLFIPDTAFILGTGEQKLKYQVVISTEAESDAKQTSDWKPFTW